MEVYFGIIRGNIKKGQGMVAVLGTLHCEGRALRCTRKKDERNASFWGNTKVTDEKKKRGEPPESDKESVACFWKGRKVRSRRGNWKEGRIQRYCENEKSGGLTLKFLEGGGLSPYWRGGEKWG